MPLELTALLGALGLVALAALAFRDIRRTGVVLRTNAESQARDTPAPAPKSYDDRAIRTAIDDLGALVDSLEKRVTECTAAVAHGIEHVERNEKRVRGVVVGALRRFEDAGYEDAGVEAEAGSLPADDDGGGGGEGVQLVPHDLVEGDELNPWLSVPGMT